MEAKVSQFLDSLKAVKANYKIYDKWEQKQADDVAKRRYLSEKLDLPKDKVELTKSKAQAVFRASDMMDKRSEDNCANMEQFMWLIGVVAVLPLSAFMYYPLYLTKKGKPMSNKQSTYFNLVAVAVALIPGIGLTLWGNAKQKEASRIGRFQAKKNELKDAKNFVIYTPEQTEAAKIIAKNIPDKKDKKSISQLLASMKEMSKDKVEYQKWLKQRVSSEEEIQKILNTEFTPEQLAQGEEDKEIIVNIVKDVNMSAETYSENVENVFDTIGMLSGFIAIPIGFGVNKILSKFKKVSPTTRPIVSIFSATLFALGMMFWETHEKKKGSRIGRFMKRQEILDNPELIMAYSDEQLKQTQNFKAPKLKQSSALNFVDNIKFFGKYLKDLKAYNKYKETTAKENEKLYEALKQTDVSEVQLKEAKNLQQKTFRTFDKIDEMSQRYSEDTEAATEIVKQLISPIFSTIAILTPVTFAYAVAKGKIPLRGIFKTVSNIALKKDSSLRVFVDKANAVMKKDKALRKDFSNIFDKNARERLINHPEIQPLFAELALKHEKHIPRIAKCAEAKDIEGFSNIGHEVMADQFKQDPFSKWVRNLSGDIFKLWANKKFKIETNTAKKIVKETPKNSDPFEPLKKVYNNYKTLCNSLLLGGFIPILGIGVGIPWAISSWFTNIQIKAGRIGIMKAMEEIDNPKLFVKNDTETNENQK